MIKKTYTIALLSNFTIKGLDEQLKKAAARYGIAIEVYMGEYGQWQQEILGEKLYAFNPDLVYVIVDFEDMDSQPEMVGKLASRTEAKIIVCNKVVDAPSDSRANAALVERFKASPQTLVFDFNAWVSAIGKKEYWNTKYRTLGDMRLAPGAFNALARELGAYLVPLAGKTKKCLVVDLDNTLWGRIIGEDGPSGIALGPEGEGKPFYEFQKYIKNLQEQGVILAIASANNAADVAEVLQKHEHMLLREDDFAAIKANWNNKAQNIQEIAKELNIGTDSMVFADDDPRNRALVRATIPEVDVIEMPAEPNEYVRTLREYKGFVSFGTTAEDKARTKMYADEKKRRIFRESSVDMERFLKGLELAIIIHPVSDKTVSRAAQLTQKTNQFNLTMRRYQEEDIKRMIAGGARAWIVGVKDKFGDYGLAGLVIAQDRSEYLEIDTLLMSCRVLGKRVEEEFFGRVLDELKKMGAKKIIGNYLSTAKNEQAKDFYRMFGFTKRAGAQNDTWEYDLAQHQRRPLDFITVNYG